MHSRIGRLATVLTSMALLGTLVTAPVTPAAAASSPIGTSALEFAPTDYPVCSFNGANQTIRFMVNRIVANSPGPFTTVGGQPTEQPPLYQQPSNADREAFRDGLHALIGDDPTTAAARLAAAGYAACSGDVDSTSFRYKVLVYHTDGLNAAATEGAPMLVLAPGRAENATVLSGPHLRAEARIKDQILDAVSNNLWHVRGAVLSGTHRCNRLQEAPAKYQGSTSMCGGTYRISDMAHNVANIFQDMHDVLRHEYPETFNLQLHGMSAAGFSISRGQNPSAGSATHPQDAITRAHSYGSEELKQRLLVNGLTGQETTEFINLTSCTPFTHSVSGLPAPVRQLHCGTRNAQLDREKDLAGEDRFLHLEQSMYIRSVYPDYVLDVMYGLFNE